MMNLDDVAAAIADGSPIAWSDSGEGPSGLTPDLVRRAQIVERIALVHARLPPTATFSSSLYPPLIPDGGSSDRESGTLLTWGPLTIVGRIGAGTYGEVYRARDPRLNRPVALKLLRRRDRLESTVITEGHLMARVRHPNVVTVYGAERIDGRVGLWMEYVDGRTLAHEVRTGGAFAPERVLSIGLDLSRALDAVHRAGLVHRDVKAQNVMCDADGRVVLTDFGAGRDLVEVDERPGHKLAGTPLYLAPEVLNGQPSSPISDIYSLGVLLFHLATGTFPVHGRSLRDISEAHAEGRRQSISDIRPKLPGALCDLISRAIDPDPARRFQRAPEMEAALLNAGSVRRSRIGRGSLLWLAAAGTAAVLIAGGIVRSVYERLAGSTQTSAAARSTAVVGATAAGRNMRQISDDSELAGPGSPSPDGSLLSYVEERTCNLAIADTRTGKRWPVTANPAPEDPAWGCAETSRFSADGSALFYVWYARAEGRQIAEIRSIPIRGGVPRTLWRAPDDTSVTLQFWAGDDRLILAGLERESGNELALIATSDGTMRAVKPIGQSFPDTASLSPDGSLLAYDRSATEDPSHRIVVAAGFNGPEEIVAESASVDRSPLWTSDGRYVVFQSDRSGTTALWAQRVERGRAVDPPVRLEPNLGSSEPMGLTRTGAYFVRRHLGTRDVFLVNLDPATGAVSGEPVRVSKVAGANGTSEWSPDGSMLAFFRSDARYRALVIKSLSDGREREIVNPDFQGVARPRWEPGGRTMLLKGTFRNVGGLHRLDLQTERINTLMRFEPHGRFQEYELFPDDRAVLYARRQGHEFVRRDLESGRETVVHRVDPALAMQCIALSRDGHRFSYAVHEREAWSMRIVDLRDPANAREILRVDKNERVCPSVWTVDGREVIFTRTLERPAPAREATRLWAANADTGQLRLIGLTVDGLNEVRLSPDGRRITYDGGWPFQEVWALENALDRLVVSR